MKLLALDGNSIVNRAFYGIKVLTTKNGEFTNGIVGFLNILEKLKEETQPDAVAIAFDLRAPTFRHKAYAGYKAQRKDMPPELAAQMPLLKELLGYLGYRIVTCEGWEADDILGTFAKVCEDTGHTCMIATGDRDSLQLVSDKTTVRLATTKFGQSAVTVYDTAAIMETYGVAPKQLIDIKAIQGDTSDNIPGVAGIGEKGAGELIRKFGSLQYIYDNLDTLDIKPGMKNKLEASKDNAFLSYDLGTIRCCAPIDTEIGDYIPTAGDPAAAAALMTRLELFKLMDRLHISADAAPIAAAENTEAAEALPVHEYADGAAILAQCEDAGEAYFVPVWENDCITKLYFCGEFAKGREVAVVPAKEAFLKAFFGNKYIKKYTSGLKPLHRAALRLGTRFENPAMDAELAAYLLNPSGSDYTVLRLAAEYGVAAGEYGDENARAAAVLPEVCAVLQKQIDEKGQHELLETIEIPLALVLGEMEESGFLVDREAIRVYGEQLGEMTEQLRREIYEDVGYEFNINSPAQLGEALFVKLGLPHGKKTKTGYSTNADVLEGLRDVHPAVNKVLRY
ncbi:MAG: DNA polymerase I, partial [Clostridia bacterium]|nr:DNA polymerase I [Clostridia bacterium]